MEQQRADLLRTKLGLEGLRRVENFRNHYLSGCCNAPGKTLSPLALETFYRFLESVTFSGSAKPSIFLTDNGALELCWEDSTGKAVQVEFRAGEIEFFNEAQQLEGTVPISEVAELAARLSA